MEMRHVSPELYLLTEDGKMLEFLRKRNEDEKNPTPDECRGPLKGVSLSYAFCGEQDFGIGPLAKMFGAANESEGIITKIPEELEIIEFDGVKAIKIGRYVELDSDMVEETKKVGIIGYWDNSQFIICASPEYEFVIDSIREMFKPNQVRFAHDRYLWGCSLLIFAF